MPSQDTSEPERLFAESPPEDESGDVLWDQYIKVVEKEDEASVKSWEGSTEGLLVFVRWPRTSIHPCRTHYYE